MSQELGSVRIARFLEELHAQLQGEGQMFLVIPPGVSWNQDLITAVRDSGSQIQSSIANAMTSCVAGRGDFIYLLPGATHAPAAAVAVNKNRVTIIGHGSDPGGPYGTLVGGVATAGQDLFTVTADDVTFRNLTLWAGNATGNAITNIGRRFRAQNCRFTNPALISQAQQSSISLATSPGNVYDASIEDCIFEESPLAIFLANGSAGPINLDRVRIRRCLFDHNTIDISASGTAAQLGLLIDSCTFMRPVGTSILTLNGNTTGLVKGCFFGVAANTQALITNSAALPAGVEYVNNATRAGQSVAKPT